MIPRLPDNAPFPPGQRARLDGFIAGLIEADAIEIATRPPRQSAEEDFPWHDPVLALEERLALAEGRSPERLPTAAMAQLDCGQCGNLCRSYAEAIASGAEPSLARYVPGGKGDLPQTQGADRGAGTYDDAASRGGAIDGDTLRPS